MRWANGSAGESALYMKWPAQAPTFAIINRPFGSLAPPKIHF
jgi:hypothetical protein